MAMRIQNMVDGISSESFAGMKRGGKLAAWKSFGSISYVLGAALAICAFGVGLYTAAPAQAETAWRVSPGESSIAFRYAVGGEAQFGKFEKFAGEGSFEPEHPASAQLSLSIGVDSIDLDDMFRTTMVKTDAWFSTQRHPEAGFVLKRLKKVSGDQYDAVGVLSIKGVELPIETMVTLRIEESRARAIGEFSFARGDFGIGDDFGAMLLDVEDEVAVLFDLAAIRCDTTRGDCPDN